MARYVVERVGANAANQHMMERFVVGILDTGRPLRPGKGYMTATEQWRAEHPGVTFYFNQRLELTSWSAASPRARESAQEAEDADFVA